MDIVASLKFLAIAIPALLLVITVVITVHEMGHFWAARLFGVKIDRFSLGFGKTLFARRDKQGVEWRIGALPIGGYVRFAADPDVAGVPDARDLAELRERIIEAEGPGAERRYYFFKPVWQRAVIAIAGPVANFLLAIFILGSLAWAIGIVVFPSRIGTVTPGSPAQSAGFRPGDEVISADGRRIQSFDLLHEYVAVRSGEPIRFEVRRGTQTIQITATPARVVAKDPSGNATVHEGLLGLGPDQTARPFRLRMGPGEAYSYGVRRTFDILGATLHYLGRIVQGRESGDQISGPIGMLQATGAVTKSAAQTEGPLWFRAASVAVVLSEWTAIISIGIGFLNLLPIPVLDGGHLLFYVYEAVARKPLRARVQELSLQVGLALLVCLMLFAGWNDLNRLGLFKFLGGLFT